MRHRSHVPAEERSILSQLHKLLNISGLMRGNLLLMKRKCGKAGCRCNKDRQLHASWYVVQSYKGKPRMRYVPNDWEQRIRAFVERHRQVRHLVEQLSEIYWKRLERREE